MTDTLRFRTWQDKAFKANRADVVVKVGGSVVYGPHLARVVNALTDLAEHIRIVIYPGGGEPDLLLERLFDQQLISSPALAATTNLALDQTGHILADQSSLFAPVRTIAEVTPTLAAGRMPVLLPAHLLSAVDVFRATNRVSSDSMAGWVAHLLRVEHLVLVKSRDFEGTTDDLRDDNVVDEVFPDLVEEYGLQWSIVSATGNIEAAFGSIK